MSFPICSFDKKCCKSTKIEVLDDFDLCINCQMIPLPAYRSTFNIDNIYFKKYIDRKNLIPKLI